MKQYVVDAFADKVFSGNPAAVCVMDKWLPDGLMAKIAIENNLSETAFVVREGEAYHIRWFTPGGEVDLCGHATLGSSYVLANFYDTEAERFEFDSLSGRLVVTRRGDLFEMDFPARMPEPVEFTEAMKRALNGLEAKAFFSRDLMLVLENEEDVLNCAIEIKAQPPGKKLQNLTLLSGGERCLTAIALLFAILQLRPSPFVVLDEVEAALDDVNVSRFTDFVRRYTARSQFILVTHRKGTMEACDRMYGVTMQERGISKILSMRIQ